MAVPITVPCGKSYETPDEFGMMQEKKNTLVLLTSSEGIILFLGKNPKKSR